VRFEGKLPTESCNSLSISDMVSCALGAACSFTLEESTVHSEVGTSDTTMLTSSDPNEVGTLVDVLATDGDIDETSSASVRAEGRV